MKIFLYRLTSLRDGKKDKTVVVGGTHYHHNQILVVIKAVDAEHAAHALNTKIVGSFDRSSINCPTIYYTSSYYEEGTQRPISDKKGYFFLSLKELEKGDEITHPDLKEKIRFMVTAQKLVKKIT
jgi:hypothetical protein